MRKFTRFNQAVDIPERRAEVCASTAMQRQGLYPARQLCQRRQACILLYLAVAFDHMKIEPLKEQSLVGQQSRKFPQKSSAQRP